MTAQAGPLLPWQHPDALQYSSPSDHQQAEALPLRVSSSKPKAHSPEISLSALKASTDKHLKNRQAQARYRERQKEKNNRMAQMVTNSMQELAKAQAALQAEREAFAAEKKQWQDQAASERLQLLAPQPVEEFVVDPRRHSVAVVQKRMPPQLMAYINAKTATFNISVRVLGWQSSHVQNVLLADNLMGTTLAWIGAFQRAMRVLVQAYDAEPRQETLDTMGDLVRGLKHAFTFFWEQELQGSMWPSTLFNACAAALEEQWGQPAADLWRRCADAMRLTPAQKATLMKAYSKWQQQTAAAQHRSAHILPGMQALQQHSTIPLPFLAKEISEKILWKCELDQRRAAAELFNACADVIKPLQHGRMEIVVHPYKPDYLKLCEAIQQSLASPSLQATVDNANLQSITELPAARSHEDPTAGPCSVSSPFAASANAHPGNSTMASNSSGSSRDSLEAGTRQQQQQQQPSHCQAAGQAKAVLLADDRVLARDGLLPESVLSDVLWDFDGGLLKGAGDSAGIMRRNSWELQDVGLDVGIAHELLDL
ncbi:hypothetical protein WJX73_002465 [Symbiochloris irregularis]|uniref:BZIP domain-containing protein n=1 Tax=Symbiochloris irregularis TaxID=706552 RepID=A0AAW1Q0S0_9CHLO